MPDMKQARSIGSFAGIAALSCCLGGVALAGAAEWELDPGRVEWRRINFEARKFFVKAATEVELAIVDSDCLELMTPAEGKPVMAGPDSAVIQITSEALGIDSQITFAMDARTGAAVQFRNLESGRRVRERIYRYTDTGAALWTRRPAEGEENAALDSWPPPSSDFRPYPPQAVGEKIIDPTGLLYIVAASDLAAPGDSVELIVYVRKQAVRLVVTVDQVVKAAELTRGSKSLTELLASAGATQALLLRLDPQPLAGPEDVEFEFLGLNRDIEIWLEPKTRLPLRVRGKVKIAGEVTIKLASAELRSQPATEKPPNCAAASE